MPRRSRSTNRCTGRVVFATQATATSDASGDPSCRHHVCVGSRCVASNAAMSCALHARFAPSSLVVRFDAVDPPCPGSSTLSPNRVDQRLSIAERCATNSLASEIFPIAVVRRRPSRLSVSSSRVRRFSAGRAEYCDDAFIARAPSLSGSATPVAHAVVRPTSGELARMQFECIARHDTAVNWIKPSTLCGPQRATIAGGSQRFVILPGV